MNRRRGERIAATVSLAITLILGWVVVSAVVWRHTADAETPRPVPQTKLRAAPEAAPKPKSDLHDPVTLPPPPVRPIPEPSPQPAEAPSSVAEETPAPRAAPRALAPAATLKEPESESVATAAVAPAPAAPIQLEPLSPDRETVRDGRALLKLLERGEGPDIEIAWPGDTRARARLYEVFESCFGMQSVVVSTDGRMYVADAPSGEAWRPDPDRVSGYARQPRGALPAGERARVAAIRNRHGLSGGRVIRVFPRHVDAMLLGALGAVATEDYRSGNSFRAVYRIVPGGVRVSDIEVNGNPVSQPILLGGDCGRSNLRG